MKPKITYQSAVAFVADIQTSKFFYTELLGQEIELDFGECIILKCGLSLWKMNPDHIIAKNRQNDPSVCDNRFEICFETDDIVSIHDQLKGNGVEFLHEIQEESWGQRTVRFYDPDGHLIEVGEYLEIFVKRLYVELGTVEKVVEKTSVPVEKVREIVEPSVLQAPPDKRVDTD